MFVFKAAVVGAGTMGGQIAQTIAAAGIPVVLKDIDDALVQAGLDEARNVTSGQVSKLVEKGKLTAEQGQAQIDEILGRIHGSTSYEGFGDVDFVIEAVPEKIEIKQAVFAELDAATPGHAILASNTSSLSITEIGEATLRPEKVDRLPLLLPGLDHAADRDRRGRGDLRRDGRRGRHVRPVDPQAADHLCRGPRLRRQPHPQLGQSRRSGASRRRRACRSRRSTRALGAAGVIPVGPYQLVNLLGLDTVLHVAEHLVESYGEERFYVPKGMQKLVADGKLGAKTGGDGFYDPQGEPNIAGDGEPDVAELVELLIAEDVRRGLPRARGGRGDPPRHRLRDDGRRRPGSATGPVAAVHEGRRRGPRRGPRAHGERRRSATASASRRRRSCAASSLRVASGRRAARASTPIPQPDAEQPAEVIKLETRADGVAIAWLANGQMNSISPQVVEDLGKVWQQVEGLRRARARDRLLKPVPVLGRRRHQGVHDDGRGGRASS